MKTAVSIAFTLVAGAALAHPSIAPHAHPHDWSLLPGADFIGIAAAAFGLSAILIATVRRGQS